MIGLGKYEERRIEIRLNAKENKDRTCISLDGDQEELKLRELKQFKKLKFLSPI